MKKSKFHTNFENAINQSLGNELSKEEFNNLKFKLNSIEENKGKTSSKDSWMTMVVLKSQSEILSFQETIKALSAGNSRYPLWIKLIKSDANSYILNFSTRFRNIKNCRNQESGFPPFEITEIDKPISEFIEQISDMDYFKYCEPNDYTIVKNCLNENIQMYGQLYSSYREDIKLNNVPKCYRIYRCDQEDLSEKGGMEWFLLRFKYTFQKLNLDLQWRNIDDDYDELLDTWYWKITLNDKEYKLLNHGINSWHVFTKEFFNMVNDQLKINNVKERAYIISKGNGGMVAFLTPQLSNYIAEEAQLKSSFYPMLPEEWYDKLNSE